MWGNIPLGRGNSPLGEQPLEGTAKIGKDFFIESYIKKRAMQGYCYVVKGL